MKFLEFDLQEKGGSAGELQRCAKARSTALMCADKFKPLLDEAGAVTLRWIRNYAEVAERVFAVGR